jgi:hypothetical protein
VRELFAAADRLQVAQAAEALASLAGDGRPARRGVLGTLFRWRSARWPEGD